jgi:hypothetical protein
VQAFRSAGSRCAPVHERRTRFRSSLSKPLAVHWHASGNGRLLRHIDLVRPVPERWCAVTSHPVDPALCQCVRDAHARIERGSAGRCARGQQLPPDRPPRCFAPKPVLRRTATIDRRAQRGPVALWRIRGGARLPEALGRCAKRDSTRPGTLASLITYGPGFFWR